MSGKPRLDANPESTVNGGVATMSLPLKRNGKNVGLLASYGSAQSVRILSFT